MKGTSELKAILGSVYYLSNEAEKAGLSTVSKLFKKLIADIERSLDQEVHADLLEEVIDSDLYKVLQILDKFSGLNRFDIRKIVQAVESRAKQKA